MIHGNSHGLGFARSNSAVSAETCDGHVYPEEDQKSFGNASIGLIDRISMKNNFELPISAAAPPDTTPGSNCDRVKGWLVGDYDWAFLCAPHVPFLPRAKKLPPFFTKDEKIPLLVAAVMGLQHALAMVAGIITAPAVIASSAGFSPKIQAWLS